MYSVSLVSLALAAGALSASATEVSIKNRDTDGLVAAIHAANMSNSDTTIHLAEDGLYTLVETADEQANSALPMLQGRLTIVGHGAELRVYSREAFGILSVGKNAEVKLVDLRSRGTR